MKNLLVSLATLLVLGLSTSFYTHAEVRVLASNITEHYDCKHDQCHAIAKSTGNRCKRCVSNAGDKFCYQHKKASRITPPAVEKI